MLPHALPAYPRDMSVHGVFAWYAKSFPDAPAIMFGSEVVTYGQLDTWTNQVARRLTKLGAAPGKVVGLLTNRSVETIVAWLAVLKCGSAYLPLDPSYPSAALDFMVQDSEPVVVLGERELNSITRAMGGVLIACLEDELEAARSEPDGDFITPVSALDTAYIMYTSGSTGRPKGVVIPHRGIVRLVRDQNYMEFNSNEVFLLISALGFDASTWEVWGALLNGARIAVVKGPRLSIDQIAKAVTGNGVTSIFLTSALFNAVVDHDIEALAGVRQLLVGGDVMSAEHSLRVIEQFPDCQLINAYGPTEATTYCVCYRLPRTGWGGGSVPIGTPLAHTSAYILDERLQPVADGEVGLLWTGGDGVAKGYLKRPELDRERFRPDPFRDDGSLMYLTGDLARMRPDGQIEFLGRNDRQVKIDGKRVELDEIELRLRRDRRLADAIVGLRKLGEDDKRIVAFLKPAAWPPAQQLTRIVATDLRRELPPHMIPHEWAVVEAYPLSHNGKVDRSALLAQDAPVTTEPSDALRDNALEEDIRRIWTQFLKRPVVDRHANIFDLGGTSMHMLRIHAEIQRTITAQVAITDLFANATIASLAGFLMEQGASTVARPASAPGTARATGLVNANGSRPSHGCGFAIIGMSGRFPRAPTVRQFWRNLCDGVESMSRFTADELEDNYTSKVRSQPDFVPVRPLLSDVDQFDAEFFGMLPREAKLTDPQHRVFLECCWEALEDAGYDPATSGSATGVFAGCSLNTYLIRHVLADRETVDRFTSDFQVGSYAELIGALQDFLATRVSYKLDLKGPSVNVQSACSTSLLAVAQACMSLKEYQSDMALAGGVSITFPQRRGYVAQDGAMVSVSGHCRPFDARADGTVFGSGAGVVVLKRIEDAIRDRDHIYAVVRGYGVNNDGASKAGFSAPSAEGQAAAILQAHAMAGISAEAIGYVECHGTATPLGDPIEFAGLVNAFRKSTSARGFCTLGTAKANVGHLDAAAGVTGLMKAALSLELETIPPLLNYSTPNPHIDLASSPFDIAADVRSWKRSDRPRMAGVSAFGVGGTNVHIVLEEAPKPTSPDVDAGHGPSILPISARSTEALASLRKRLASHLQEHSELSLQDTAWTLQVGRKGFACRTTVVASSRQQAIDALLQPATGMVREVGRDRPAPKVAFMFPGQGAQYAGMGRGLYEAEPAYRAAIDQCAAILKSDCGHELIGSLYPASKGPGVSGHPLGETRIAQPAIFAVEYSLAKLWASWGIRPEVMLGHSIGEFVAACLAGVFSLQDALTMVAARGRLMQNMPAGGMLSVRLGEHDLARRLGPELAIAAVNAPALTVVAGPLPALAALEKQLSDGGIIHRRLETSHAFHSAMMDSVLAPFHRVVEKVRLSAPQLEIISSVTGRTLGASEATDPSYWARHLREKVAFSPAVAMLRQRRELVLLEVGPGAALSTLARQHPACREDQAVIASLPNQGAATSAREGLLTAVGALWTAGLDIDWRLVHGEAAGQRCRVPLPTYPFERRRHWLDRAQSVTCALPELPGTASAPEPVIDDMSNSKEKRMGLRAAHASNANLSSSRLDEIKARMIQIFMQLSDLNIDGDAGGRTFLEFGFNSLFLTQAARAMENSFGVKIAFRQLMEGQSNFDALAQFIDKSLPPDTAEKQPSTVATKRGETLPAAVRSEETASPTAQSDAAADQSSIERIAQQQIDALERLFAKQLDALAGTQVQRVAPSAAPRPRDAHTAASSAPSLPAPKEGLSTSGHRDLTVQAQKPFGPFSAPQRQAATALSPQKQEKLHEIIERVTRKTPIAKAQTQRYRSVLADPRVVSGFRDAWKEMVYPIVADRSRGSRIWDIDGNEYVDLLNGFGPIILGHRPDFLEAALREQIVRGFEIGPQTPLAGEVAELFCELTGNERMTFCNTGSEAVMAALRLARTVTGRDKVVTFAGDYHGMFDEVLIKSARSKAGIPGAQPIAPGIPRASVSSMTVLDYGTPEALEWIRANSGELAAVLVEPIQSRRPGFRPVEFLKAVREITAQSNTALIFDEVVTGFRVHQGGAQALFGIRADIATYGKVLGGGMPIGVLAGSCRFLDALDGGMWRYGDNSVPEVGVTFFAGTFVRHPLTLAAVKAMLQHLKAAGPELQERLGERTAGLVARINDILDRYAIPTRIETSASVMYFSFPPEETFAPLFYYLLREQGLHILEGFPCFMTTAHSDADLDAIAAAFETASAEMREAELLGRSSVGVAAITSPVEVTPAALPVPPGSVPLTEPQREVLLAAMLGDDASCAFNESVSIRLVGMLDVEALKASLADVVLRHEALRGTVDPEATHLTIAQVASVDLHSVDLSNAPDPQADLNDLLAVDARTAFDLAAGPLMRGFTARIGEFEHVLVLTTHHVVCDGWSANIIMDELAELYSARVECRAPRLEPVVSFAQYAAAQPLKRRSAERTATEAFWLKRYSSAPALVELPLDRPRSTVRTYPGDTLRHSIPRKTRDRIRELGAKHGASMFVTMFAGFNALVMRLSGQSDIVVGVPTAGQSLEPNGVLVGHCVNFLPIRTTVQSDVSFAQLLAETKSVVLDAYEHQDFTYGTLVQKLIVARDPSRLPLTELQFNLEQVASGVKFARLETSVTTNPKAAVNSDIFFNIIERADGLEICCDYNTDLFDAATIAEWLVSFEQLLVDAAADPARLVSAPVLPDVIRTKKPKPGTAGLTVEDAARLAEWNSTQVAYPVNANVVTMFEAQALHTPESVALSQGAGVMTYAELNQRANRLAHHLVAAGVQPGTIVGICLERTPELVVALLAVLKAGAAYVPLDPSYPSDRLAFMLTDAQTSILVTESQYSGLVPQATVPHVLVDRDTEAILAQPATNPGARIGQGDLAYVIYTSGSTGTPKGVAIPHGALANFLNSMRDKPGLSGSDVLAAVTTVSFDIAGLELYLPLVVGARVELVARQVATEGAELARVLVTSGVTVLQATPATWRMLLDADWQGSERLKALCGGEALTRDLSDKLLTRVGELWNLYGPTETTIWSTLERIEPGSSPVCIGRPIANTEVHVLDEHGACVPIGIEGEIWIGGAGVAAGYHRRPELTVERFVADRFSGRAGARLYRTGDLGRWLPDGRLQHLGRIDHQVKLRGFRIELGEIEALLQQVPGVKQSCVVAESSSEGAGRLIAFNVPTAPGVLKLQVMLDHLNQKLPSFMVPAAFVTIDSFPLTANGKLDRNKLLEIERQRRAERVQVAAVTPDEDRLAKIVSEVMRLDSVGVTDNLFELGVDSLRIFQIASRAAKEAIAVTPRAILQGRTIRASLAKAAESNVRPSTPEVSATITRVSRQKFRAGNRPTEIRS